MADPTEERLAAAEKDIAFLKGQLATLLKNSDTVNASAATATKSAGEATDAATKAAAVAAGLKPTLDAHDARIKEIENWRGGKA